MSMPLPTRNPLDLVKIFAGIMTPNTDSVTGGDAFVHGLRGNDHQPDAGRHQRSGQHCENQRVFRHQLPGGRYH